jgi:hypothetical protein
LGYCAEKTYKLKFEQHPGLEVETRSTSVGELFEILPLADQVKATAPKEAVEQLFGWFAKLLISWNLEHADGSPVPPTYEGLMTQDLGFALTVTMGWVVRIAAEQGVDLAQVFPTAAPKNGAAANGRPSTEAALGLPVEPLPETETASGPGAGSG